MGRTGDFKIVHPSFAHGHDSYNFPKHQIPDIGDASMPWSSWNHSSFIAPVEVAKQFNIPIIKIKKAVVGFKGLEGRLQYVKTVNGARMYNDNNATTPTATVAGIEALKGKDSNIILVCGGADKKLPLDNFVKAVNKHCKAVVMIPGTGTEKLLAISYQLSAKKIEVKSLKDAINEAIHISHSGDVILFSPAFASFGMFNNEYERNDLFVKIIKGLK